MLGGDSLTVMSDSVLTGSKTRFCPVCQAKGNSNKLRLYQINLTEAVLLCTGEKCTYPMGVEPSQNIIFLRDAASATFSRKRKLPASPACADKQVQSGMVTVTQASIRSTLLNRSRLANDTGVLGVKMSFKTSSNGRKEETPTEASSKQKGFKSYLAETGKKPISMPNVLDEIVVSRSGGGDSSENHSMYPQWCCQGVNCWLNAVLSLLVHSSQLQQRTQLNHTKSDLLMLIKKFNLARVLYKQTASKLNGEKHSGLDRMHRILQDEPSSVIKRKVMHRDKNQDEAVCGLKSLLNSEPSIVQKCWMINTEVTGFCDQCNRQHSNRFEIPILTVSKPEKNFSMCRIEEVQQICDKCSSESFRTSTSISHYPLVLFAQFIHGLQSSSPAQYDFSSPSGTIYRVKGIIQHRSKTNRYVTWIRDIESGKWMECDDQKDILCSFSVQDLPFPLSEVRLVMWETQEVKISSAGQSVSGGTTGEPTDSKILCSTSPEKQQAVKLLTEPERVKGSSETASEQGVRARFERKNLEVLPSSAATPCVSDKQTSLENQLPGKATHNRWPRRTGEIGNNVSHSPAKKGTSAETLRIQRMRERFLKDKQKLEARRPMLDIEKCSSNNPLIPHYAGSVTKNTVQSDPQKCDTSRNGTEPVQQCLQASSAKRLDNRCADQTAEGNAAKLQNTVLDRVLKYLPKGAVPKLPFINIEQTSSIDKSKSKGKGKVSFQGYVPKSTITKSNCENRELSASEKDTSDANGSSSLEKPVDRTESLRESCNQRTNKLRLSVSPGRAGIMLTTDLSPFKKRLKRNTEELQGSQVTPVKGILTLTKRRLDSSGSLPIKKRHLSIPGITPVTSDHERVVHSQEYSSHNVASTANQMNHSQNTGDKAELLKTPQISSANGTTAFHSPYGLNEMESTAFSQSTMWPDNNNADMFGLGQCSLDADLTMLNNFAASPIKAPHLSIDSWIQPSYTEHLPVASGPDFSPTFASYPYCQSAHPVNMDRRSSERFLVNPVLSDSPEKTNVSLLMDGRTKVHWL